MREFHHNSTADCLDVALLQPLSFTKNFQQDQFQLSAFGSLQGSVHGSPLALLELKLSDYHHYRHTM